MDCSTPGFSQSLLKLISIEAVMPSNHSYFVAHFSSCLSIFPSIRVLANESALPFNLHMDPNFSLMHCVNVIGYISIHERYIVFLCISCFKPTKYFAIDLIQLLCLLSLMFLSYNYVIICTFFSLFLTAVYHYSIFHIIAISSLNDRTHNLSPTPWNTKKNFNKQPHIWPDLDLRNSFLEVGIQTKNC